MLSMYSTVPNTAPGTVQLLTGSKCYAEKCIIQSNTCTGPYTVHATSVCTPTGTSTIHSNLPCLPVEPTYFLSTRCCITGNCVWFF